MHDKLDSFPAAQRSVMDLTTQVMCMAYELGDPVSRANMSIFEAIAHEADGSFESILVEVRYAVGRAIGDIHYWMSPVFSERDGYRTLRQRVATMFAGVGRELIGLDPVHITESDCWGMMVRLKI